ncbi:MAG: response regulator transcription factor [Azoarcus sp.]|jgi:DNA-binding NarL/FixJ family response regulator|nr:response regulator transcription factor [Azoarcus sp.]
MMRNLFLVTGTVTPSPRWQEAFADGVSLTREAAVSSGMKTDVVWLGAGETGWLEWFPGLIQQFPGIVAVVVSDAPSEGEAMSALTAGARGYCHAWASPGQLREVAQVVSRGGYWVGTDLMYKLVGMADKRVPAIDELPKVLSERESEVAHEVIIGRSNKEIAKSLSITERTVKAHLGAIFAKLGVRDRLQLALLLTSGKDK